MEKDEIRTTVNSLRSSASNAGAFIGLLVSGWLAIHIGILAVWGIVVVVLLCTCILFFLQKEE